MKLVCPPFKGENKGHYSAGVISKGMLYVSGQLSIDPDTREVCKGDIKDHTRLALDNVDRVLKEAGVRRDQVVFCRVYTPSVEYWGPINEVYAEFFGDHRDHPGGGRAAEEKTGDSCAERRVGAEQIHTAGPLRTAGPLPLHPVSADRAAGAGSCGKCRALLSERF